MDLIAQLKEQEKLAWSNFTVLENLTGTASPRLVKFAGIERGAEVLDVACGTGVLGLTAARLGAKVTGIDLTPELIAAARQNAAIMKLEASWMEADAEALPFPDAKFDFVISQFGHMFAPRAELARNEMLRVLKPGGTIAFATWPTELFMGRVFSMMLKFMPPLPPGITLPLTWGDPNNVRELLGSGVRDLMFTRDAVFFQTLSVQHYLLFMERNLKPVGKLLQMLDVSDPAKARGLRLEMEGLAANYFENNSLRQDYLMTRALKL